MIHRAPYFCSFLFFWTLPREELQAWVEGERAVRLKNHMMIGPPSSGEEER